MTSDNVKIPELLAPAGGMEQLKAAVRFGADAVYLATDRFGMRQRAINFTMDELACAVRYAHEAGVDVHVTCNILMYDSDIAQLPEYYEALDALGVDALIIGDLGAAALARKYAPNIALHVSTQASVANAEAARVWQDLGASRIVLARELSLDQISALRQELPDDLELEAFVHGAMCMAVSGRCLISSYLTGRSGNRGHCTQPCRWNYQAFAPASEPDGESPHDACGLPGAYTPLLLEEEKRPGEFFELEQDSYGSFIMNAKDLNMLAHVHELAEIGVDSLKIEGRNKKAFYVATVVNAYRQVLDGADPAAFAEELLTISHRPYGTGFYFGMAPQAPDYDGYEQTCLHVADVLETKQVDEQTYELTVRCRNRFSEGDELEVLTPKVPPFGVTVKDLAWLGEATDDGMPAVAQAAAVANRANETGLYRFRVTSDVEPGSYLRRRQFRRSARSGC
ncbi:MAG: peptidase U32 family protein [Eggerthellaceae bacterium]|nr:peptidase U32 family protein [Eggerthellaceae bacterium]